MKKSILFLIMVSLMCLTSACGARDKEVNLTKTGELYTTEDGVSFYYPKDYEISVVSDLDDLNGVNTVEFTKDNNMLYFTVVNDNTDNLVEDKDELYTGMLEQSKASDVEVLKPVFDSGLDVYEYIYEYSETGVKSKEIVYFLEDKTYIYGYRTVKDEFADNEEEMTVYLESFSMAVGK